jgi:hypothetical protein
VTRLLDAWGSLSSGLNLRQLYEWCISHQHIGAFRYKPTFKNAAPKVNSLNEMGEMTAEQKKIVPRLVVLEQLRREREEEEDCPRCQICFDEAPNCTVQPCKHSEFCTDCASKCDRCPLCRVVITAVEPLEVIVSGEPALPADNVVLDIDVAPVETPAPPPVHNAVDPDAPHIEAALSPVHDTVDFDAPRMEASPDPPADPADAAGVRRADAKALPTVDDAEPEGFGSDDEFEDCDSDEDLISA